MQGIPVSKLQRILARAACGAVMFGCVLAQASAQGNGSPASAGGSIQLQPYTAPDNSASAGVPAGWKVTKGEQTVIQMTGPQGETIFLGNTMIARNAPFQPGQRATGGTDLSMPYSASLAQKLTMILEQGAAVGGKPAPQVTITSATPIPLPPSLGQCGRFVAGITNPAGPMKIMGASAPSRSTPAASTKTSCSWRRPLRPWPRRTPRLHRRFSPATRSRRQCCRENWPRSLSLLL